MGEMNMEMMKRILEKVTQEDFKRLVVRNVSIIVTCMVIKLITHWSWFCFILNVVFANVYSVMVNRYFERKDKEREEKKELYERIEQIEKQVRK